jgi:hemerythrin superfamily protein
MRNDTSQPLDTFAKEACVDAIVLLKNDHKTVEKLFKQFEKAGDEAYEEKRKIVQQLVEELSVHAHIEEQIFYPEARADVPETEDHVLESLEEHHIVKWVLSELHGMDPQDERYDAKVTVLAENVRHHVEEEEQEWFPEVRKTLGRKRLQEIGTRLEKAKSSAPRTPQPKAPDEPKRGKAARR